MDKVIAVKCLKISFYAIWKMRERERNQPFYQFEII